MDMYFALERSAHTHSAHTPIQDISVRPSAPNAPQRTSNRTACHSTQPTARTWLAAGTPRRPPTNIIPKEQAQHRIEIGGLCAGCCTCICHGWREQTLHAKGSEEGCEITCKAEGHEVNLQGGDTEQGHRGMYDTVVQMTCCTKLQKIGIRGALRNMDREMGLRCGDC